MAIRYPDLQGYYNTQVSHPGFPSDYATLHQGGRPYRLMVMSDSQDVILEQVGGGLVELLGQVHDPEVVDAILDPLWARHELEGTLLGLDEVTAAFAARPEDAAGEQALIATYRARQAEVERVLRPAQRASYAVVAIDTLPETPTTALHRRDLIAYDKADWARLSRIAAAYLEAGLDPLDSFAVRSHGYDAGLTSRETNWLESLFVDPVRLGDQGYANGRHRTEACRAAGATHIVVDTRSELPAAIRQTLLIRAGAPALSDLQAPPSELAPALPEQALSL